MTHPQEAISDLDLLAYADGKLDHDLGRRRAVEAYLEAHPAEAARVADFRAQNEALREAGRRWLDEATPERLLGALDGRRGRWSGRRAGVLAASILTAAVAGWAVGHYGDAANPEMEVFAQEATERHRQSVGEVVANGIADASNQPIVWLNRSVDFKFQAPDLSGQGFRLVGKRHTVIGGEQAVQLRYRQRDGTIANLFLRPRWTTGTPAVTQGEEDGVTTYQWFDGPVAIVMTKSEADDEDAQLVESVRSAVAGARLSNRERVPTADTVHPKPAGAAIDRRRVPGAIDVRPN
jgi:anti-sigma factor RsiW